MYEDENLTFREFIKKKSVIVLVSIMLFCVIFNVIRDVRVGVFIDEKVFVTKRDNQCYKGGKYIVKYKKEKDCIKYIFTCGKMQKDVKLYWDGENAIVKFSDGRKIVGLYSHGVIENIKGETEGYWNSDNILDEGEEIQNFPIDDYDLATFVCKAYKGYTEMYAEGKEPLWITAILVFPLGMCLLYFPNKIFFFWRRWMYEDAKLSDLGMCVQKISGVSLIVLSFIWVFMGGL